MYLSIWDEALGMFLFFFFARFVDFFDSCSFLLFEW